MSVLSEVFPFLKNLILIKIPQNKIGRVIMPNSKPIKLLFGLLGDVKKAEIKKAIIKAMMEINAMIANICFCFFFIKICPFTENNNVYG